jgi:hypothetical protein
MEMLARDKQSSLFGHNELNEVLWIWLQKAKLLSALLKNASTMFTKWALGENVIQSQTLANFIKA